MVLRRSSFADVPSSSCSRFLGAVEHVLPSPEAVWRRLRASKLIKDLVMLRNKTTALAEQDGGFSEPRSDDFPSVEGLLRIQGICGGATAARHRHVLFVVDGVVFQKDLLVILPLFWFSLKGLVLISPNLFREKNAPSCKHSSIGFGS
jgi:hypothetical protein